MPKRMQMKWYRHHHHYYHLNHAALSNGLVTVIPHTTTGSQLGFRALAEHISMTMVSFLKMEGEISRHKHTQRNTKSTLFQSRLTMMGFFISRPEGRIFPYSKQTGTEIACHYQQPPSISALTPAYQPHLRRKPASL